MSSNAAAEKKNSPGSEKRVAFAALQHRDFRFFFVTTMLAMMADNIEHVISYWLLFQKFQSPVLAGFADISHWTPFLLLSVYFGGIADRYDCRKIIQLAQIMYMGVSMAWAVLFFTDTIQIWQASILLILHGIAGVLWTPAEQLMIHDIVGTEHIQSAVRLNATSRQLGILFGPAVGAGLMLWLGPPMALLANALIYLPMTLWLLVVPYTGHLREGAPPKRAIGWKDAVSVVREVWHNRPIITMVILGGSASLFVGNAFHTQMPEFAHDLGAGQGGFYLQRFADRQRGRSGLRRLLARRQGLAQSQRQDGDHLRHVVVRVDRRVCVLDQLFHISGLVILRRDFESFLLFDRPGDRAVARAGPSARAADRSFYHVGLRPAGFQRSYRGRRRRIDRDSLVPGPERDGVDDGDLCTTGVCRACTGRGS